MINNLETNKRFWGLLKHAKADSTGVHPLKNNGTLISEPQEKASLLNSYFYSVFTREPPLTLKQHCLNSMQENSYCYPTMPEITVTSEGIVNFLKNLKTNKASGPDNLAPTLLKELSTEIAPILQKIFAKSLHSHIVPNDWKKARISPIFKKGDKDRPENYRPSSLTCVCSKILENIATSCIMSHLEAKISSILYNMVSARTGPAKLSS